MSHFNIVSNIDNGVGLEADSKLLKSLLESWGHTARLIHYKKRGDIEEAPRAKANFHLEVACYDLMSRKVADKNIYWPNCEWFAPWDHKTGLPDFDHVWCKTNDAVKIMQKYTDVAKIAYIGFEAKDLYDPTIERQRKFLHVAGQSRYKNTSSVAYCFANMLQDEDVKPELTIIGAYPEEYHFALGAKNITTHQRVSDDEMKQLLNSHLFHVLPAGYEGYGQALNEGLGTSSVVITTRHPPMSDFPGVPQDLLVPYQDLIVELAAMRARVVAAPVRDMVKKALKLKPERIEEIQRNARAAFLSSREEFRTNFKNAIDKL